MTKTCKQVGCRMPVFGNGYCKGHQYKRDDIKKFIKSKSNKRTHEEKQYKRICDEIDKDAKTTDSFRCFFSGKSLTGAGRPDHHHTRGRGKFYLEKKYIVLALRKYHGEYHSLSVSQLEETEWYEGFMIRLKERDMKTWEKEVEKKHK